MAEVQQQINAGRTSGVAMPKKPGINAPARPIQQPQPVAQATPEPAADLCHPSRLKWLTGQLQKYPHVFHQDREWHRRQAEEATDPSERRMHEEGLREHDEVLRRIKATGRRQAAIPPRITRHSARDYGVSADREFSKTLVPRVAGKHLGQVRGFDIYLVPADMNVDGSPEDEVWINDDSPAEHRRQAILDAVIEKTVAKSTSSDPVVEMFNKAWREAIDEVRGRSTLQPIWFDHRHGWKIRSWDYTSEFL